MMSGCSRRAAQPLSRCLRTQTNALTKSFSTTSKRAEATGEAYKAEIVAAKPQWNPEIVTSRKGEKNLFEHGIMPIGSRRRRAAIGTSQNIPFEQLPYQTFQEARAVLQTDREKKIKEIEIERGRIQRLEAKDAKEVGGEQQKRNKLDSMRRHLEHLKILADINDPMIKKRFEDGEGDMTKPIYRYLAEQKWSKYQKLLIEQRIHQLSIVPDVFPHFVPTSDVRLAFGRRNVQPGEIVDSRVTEIPARLKIQVFDKGERLVSVVVVDNDVPVPEKDWFTSRAHYVACNIPLSPTQTSLPLAHATPEQTVLSWLPPFAQKGTPYHRYSIFVLEQKPGQTMDVAALKEATKRDGFNLRGWSDRHALKPIGLGLFRSVFDEGTVGVMTRHNIPGADIEYKRPRLEALKPKEKAKGWEARHASTKYRAIWRNKHGINGVKFRG